MAIFPYSDICVKAKLNPRACPPGRLCGGTGLVFSSLPTENVASNYVKVVQRVPVRIDFDRTPGQEFNVKGMLKPVLSVEPKVKVR